MSPLRRNNLTLRRDGFLMPIVLIALATLTLAVTIFSEQMLAEYKATRSMADHLQAACAAQSGVEFVRVSLSARHVPSDKTMTIQPLNAARDSGFWIVGSREDASSSPRFGMTNESGKLNLNGLALDLGNAESSRHRLMQLPNMTPQIADAILDWIDADDAQRVSGAERNWYSAAHAPRLPAQGAFKDLTELLFVRGVTSELLYGEDANGNGWLDECENDGAITPPNDNADGRLNRGWSEYLTVVGAESNYRSDGRLKVHLNNANLAQMYDQLLPELGQAATQFIVALRLEGPRQQGDVAKDSEQNERDERLRSAQQRLKDQLDRNSQSGPKRRAETRGGLDLSAQPTFVIQSMVDLIGCEVLTMVDGQQELLKSPWDTSRIEATLAKLEQIGTTKPGQQLTQRINLQYAPERVLRTIPGIDSNKAKAIAARGLQLMQRDGDGKFKSRSSVGWLVTDGLLTLEQLRAVAPYITMGGDVWSGTSIGATVRSPSLASVHFVIDATLPETRLLTAHESMPFTLPVKERPQL